MKQFRTTPHVLKKRLARAKNWAYASKAQPVGKDKDDSSLFRSLTPKNNIDLGSYKSALDFAFSDDRIRNIALSGTYGSGKSSVINSYEKSCDKRFIYISLAHFDEQGHKEDQTGSTEASKLQDTPSNDGQSAKPFTDGKDITNILEGKILNQLLHQIEPKEIPLSNFRVKTESSFAKRLAMVGLILVFIIAMLYFVCFNAWCDIVAGLGGTSALMATTNPVCRLWAGLICFVLIVIWLWRISKTHNLQNTFKKIDLKGIVGIEIFESSDESYFDKYLNEVLYLFEQADAEAIVFEDLDRHDVTKIFEKLREINDLINKKRQNEHRKDQQNSKSNKSPLRFFYLIRDDIFTSSDRTKFFDFIIPVVPVIDTSNSCDMFLKRLDEDGLLDRFSKHFLQDISLYFSDMRLVDNIVNEYVVYWRRLEGSGLATEPDRQLAMIIYKNLYPKDFNLLQGGLGYVCAMFEKKRTLINEQRLSISQQIEDLQRRIENADAECLESIDELNALFLPFDGAIMSIDGNNISAHISRASLIKQMLSCPENIRSRDRNGNQQQINIAELREKMENNPEYHRRKSIIEDKQSDQNQQLGQQISDLRKRQAELATMSLKELLNVIEDADDDFWNCSLPPYESPHYVSEIQNSRYYNLLIYLIRNGYIDENYSAYVSYFYPNNFTTQDRNFLLSLTDRKAQPYEYHLDYPSNIYARLSDDDFSRKELRNFDLLEFLLESGRTATIQTWLTALEEPDSGGSNGFDFLIQFLQSGRERKQFVRIVNREHPDWFQKWSTSGLLSGVEWKKYALDTIYHSDLQTLKTINKDGWLGTSISADKDFLKIDDPDISLLIRAFDALNVQFSFINFRAQDLALVNAVYEGNYYVLNPETLQIFMDLHWMLEPIEIGKRSYTHLRMSLDSPLSKRIAANMSEYMKAILSENDVRFNDDEDAAIALLNNSDVALEDKNAYIDRMDTVLKEICAINDVELWPLLLTKRKIKYTWENISDYYEEICDSEKVLSPALVEFINSSDDELSWGWDALNERIGNDFAHRLRAAFVQNDAISLSRYESALKSMSFVYESFSFLEMPTERMQVLFKLGMISVTEKNISHIRDNYPSLFTDYIILNDIEKLLKLLEQGEVVLTSEELSNILEDERLSVDSGLSLLEVSNNPITLAAKEFSDTIRAKIIETNFDSNDTAWLLQAFSKQSNVVREAFVLWAKQNSDIIYEVAEQIRYIPLELYACLLEILPEQQAEDLRKYLPDPAFEDVCTLARNPSFSDTEHNRIILEYFKKHDWISRYSNIPSGGLRAYYKRT